MATSTKFAVLIALRQPTEVTAVNWGQWHGPYALPPERLILCASGAAFLWLQGGRAVTHVILIASLRLLTTPFAPGRYKSATALRLQGYGYGESGLAHGQTRYIRKVLLRHEVNLSKV